MSNTSMLNGSAPVCSDPECLRHPHWHQFDEASYGLHASVGLIMTIVSLLSIGGNTFVLFVYSRFPALRTPSHYLILNLSISDLGMAVTGFPLYIIASFRGKWPFSAQVCEFYGFAGGAFGLLSINTLAAISVERFIVIVRSKGHRNTLSGKVAILMICVVWIYSFAWAMPPLFGWNKYTWEGFGTTCSFDYLTRTEGSSSFIMAMTVGGFVVPLVIILFCYGFIMVCVWQQRRNFNQTSNKMDGRMIKGGREQHRHQVEIDTARAILLMIGLFCLSWVPYTVVAMIGVYGDQSVITPMTSAFPGILAKSSTLYNPVLYALCLPKFKKKIRAMALKLCCGIEGDLVVVDNWSYVMTSEQDSQQFSTEATDRRSSMERVPMMTYKDDSHVLTNANVDSGPIDATALAHSINRDLRLLQALIKQNKTGENAPESLKPQDVENIMAIIHPNDG